MAINGNYMLKINTLRLRLRRLPKNYHKLPTNYHKIYENSWPITWQLYVKDKHAPPAPEATAEELP